MRLRGLAAVTRPTLSAGLVVAALVLTAAVALVMLAGPFRTGAGPPGGRPFDLLVFATMWLYIVVTPLAVLSAVLLGDRRSAWTRAGLVVAVVWLAFILWTATMTL